MGGDACLLRGSDPGGPGLLPPRVLNPSQAFSSCHPGLPPENWEVCRGPPPSPSHLSLPCPPPWRQISAPPCLPCPAPAPLGHNGHLDPWEVWRGEWLGLGHRSPGFPKNPWERFASSFQTLKGKELSSNPCSTAVSLFVLGNLSADLSLGFLISETEMILPMLPHLWPRTV